MHRLNTRNTRPLLALALATALAAGCSSSQNTTNTTPRDTPRSHADLTAPAKDGLVSSGRSFTGGQLTPVGNFVIDHDAWGRVGYRWDWSSAAPLAAGRTPTGLYAWPDRVAVTDSGTVVTVFDPITGKVTWTARTDTPTSRIVGLERDDNRFIVATNTRIYELDVRSGNILTAGDAKHLVSTPPAVIGDRVYFGTPQGEIVGYDRRVRLPIARYDAGAAINTQPLALDERTVGVVTQRGEVLFLDTVDNAARSRFKIYGDAGGTPVADAGYVWVASLDQSVYLFDANEGVRPWRYRTPHPLRKAPVLIGSDLYVASEGGLIKLNADGRTDTGLIRANGVELWTQTDLPDATVIGTRQGDLITWSGTILSRVDPDNGDIIEQAYLPGIDRIDVDAFDDGNLYAQTAEGHVIRFRQR